MPKLTERQQSVFEATIRAAARLLRLKPSSLKRLHKHVQACGTDHEIGLSIDNTVRRMIKAAMDEKQAGF